jgi:hypothetical protein
MNSPGCKSVQSSFQIIVEPSIPALVHVFVPLRYARFCYLYLEKYVENGQSHKLSVLRRVISFHLRRRLFQERTEQKNLTSNRDIPELISDIWQRKDIRCPPLLQTFIQLTFFLLHLKRSHQSLGKAHPFPY